MKQLKIVIEKTSTGYSAYCSNHNGIFTTGYTVSEVKLHIKEVIQHLLDYYQEKGDLQNMRILNKSSVVYFLDIVTFFEEFKMLNQTELAKYIGINESHLRKLKSGLMNLSSKKAEQLQNSLHKLGVELQSIHFNT